VFICSAAITAEEPAKAEQGFLQRMCDEGLARARAKGAGTIDVQRTMREVQRRALASNAKEPDPKKHTRLHVDDGVHLNDLGQLAMGYAILKGLGAPADVSRATVDAHDPAAATGDGCRISAVSPDPDGVSFTRIDERLPLNLQPLWMLYGYFIPISDELNRYSLAIKNLPEGRYAISAGGRPLGAWTAAELSRGINIASASADPWVPGGPWDAQGHALKTLTDVRDELAVVRRGLDETLGAHPRVKRLETETIAIEKEVVALQRELSRPVPVRFIVRKESKQ